MGAMTVGRIRASHPPAGFGPVGRDEDWGLGRGGALGGALAGTFPGQAVEALPQFAEHFEPADVGFGDGCVEQRVEPDRQGKAVRPDGTGERAEEACVSEGEQFHFCLHEWQYR